MEEKSYLEVCPKCGSNNVSNIALFSNPVKYEWECNCCKLSVRHTERKNSHLNVTEEEINDQLRKNVLNYINILKGLSPDELKKIDSGQGILDEWDSSFKIIEEIFTNGNCGRFYHILKFTFYAAKPYGVAIEGMEDEISHVVTKIGNNYYDITGEFTYKIGDKNKDNDTIVDIFEIDDETIYTNMLDTNYSFNARGPII